MRINKNTLIKKFVRLFGFEAVKPGKIPRDIDKDAIEIIRAVEPYTMLNWGRLFAFITAARYIARHDIAGAVVECGVWRGGSIAAAALALKAAGECRPMYLFDTFEGMSAPTDHDRKIGGGPFAVSKFAETQIGDESSDWCRASLEDVRGSLAALGLNPDEFHFVKGMVEKTIPAQAPTENIALLRLDTDWYESTRHEFEHLYPRLVDGGVLIVDDYGDWEGARRAVDEYLAANGIRMLLTRVEGSVVGVKQAHT